MLKAMIYIVLLYNLLEPLKTSLNSQSFFWPFGHRLVNLLDWESLSQQVENRADEGWKIL